VRALLQTVIRKCIRDNLGSNRSLDALLPHVKGNVGFVFARHWADLADLCARVEAVEEQVLARAGTVAPCAVVIPRGPTYMEPGKTGFFAGMNISTKIFRGCIEINYDVPLLAAGAKVTASHAALLQALGLKPFAYRLVVRSVYVDGEVHPVSLLNVTDDHVVARLGQGVADVAALSLHLGYPTAACVPYVLARGFRQLLAVSLATDYTFPQAASVKQLLADTGALAAASSTTAVPPMVHRLRCDCGREDDHDDDDNGEILMWSSFGEGN
jgi:large subunit ribosomal protein LP0